MAGRFNDLRDDIGNAGGDCRDQHKFDEEECEIEVLCDDLTFAPCRRAYEDCQLPQQCRYDKLD